MFDTGINYSSYRTMYPTSHTDIIDRHGCKHPNICEVFMYFFQTGIYSCTLVPITPTKPHMMNISGTKTRSNHFVACGKPAGLFFFVPPFIFISRCASLLCNAESCHSALRIRALKRPAQEDEEEEEGLPGVAPKPDRSIPPFEDIGNNLVRCEVKCVFFFF